MKASFENSVAVLVRAYMNDELQHGNCSACAVGNLMAACNGYTFMEKLYGSRTVKRTVKRWREDTPAWDNVFCTDHDTDEDGVKRAIQEVNASVYDGNPTAKRQIDSTGYGWEDLARIEFVFETHRDDYHKDRAMFNGLLAVVDVLAEIHGVDLTTKQAAVGQFETVHASK